jgi:hypothetical protein
MARVPADFLQTVEPTAQPPSDYQNIRATPADFGAQVGEAAKGAGQAAVGAADKGLDVAIMRQQRYNAFAVNDAYSGFQTAATNITNGDPNAQDEAGKRGYLGSAGIDAMNGRTAAEQKIDELRKETLAGLKNDAQRLEFDQQSRRYQTYMYERIGSHYDQQMKVWGANSEAGQLESTIRSASANWNDDVHFNASLHDAREAAIRESQNLNGNALTPQMFQAAWDKADSKMITGRAMAWGATDPAGALKWIQTGQIAGLRNPDGTPGKPVSVASRLDPTELLALTTHFKGKEDEASVAAAAGEIGARYATPGVAPSGAVTPSPMATGAIADNIRQEAAARGMPADIPLTMAMAESRMGGPDDPGNPHKGVFQMGDEEWRSVGGTDADRADRVAQVKRGMAFVQRDMNIASNALGRPAEGWEVWTTHVMGEGAGPALLLAPAETNAVDAIAATVPGGRAQALVNVISNGGTPEMTAGEYRQHFQNAYAAAAKAAGAAPSGPAPAIVPASATEPAVVAIPTPGAAPQQPPASADHQPAAFTAEYQMVQQAWQTAKQRFPDRPDLQRKTVGLVYEQIQQANVLQAKFEAEQAKAKRDNEEAAGQAVITTLAEDAKRAPGTPAKFDPVKMIWENPALDLEHKRVVAAAAQECLSKLGVQDILPFGSGYAKAYSGIFAPEGDPNRIATAADILRRAGPGGDLTLTGADTLVKVLQMSRKDPYEAGIHVSASGLINYAKTKLSFEEDTGPIKIRDPKGEAIFNSQFLPKFESAFAEWQKPGKNPWEFLTRDNVDKLMEGMRSPTQMAQDRLFATGQTAPQDVEKPGTPIPPAPAGFNTGEWSSIMSAPPTAENGQPYTHAAWAEVLRRLAADPKAIPWFDQRFGAAGYSGADLVKRLKSPVNAGGADAIPLMEPNAP